MPERSKLVKNHPKENMLKNDYLKRKKRTMGSFLKDLVPISSQQTKFKTFQSFHAFLLLGLSHVNDAQSLKMQIFQTKLIQ